MPGTILDIKVSSGQTVKTGDVLFILEAMKMENEIMAPVDGVVQVVAAKGSSVNTGDLLASIQ
jgi:biotin carboxyl carrier protein